jgi:hypothetical protein
VVKLRRPTLPEKLKGSLPTVEELENELKEVAEK